MSITCTATLTTTGSATAPKLGDVLDYRVVITGDTDAINITPSPVVLTPPGGVPQTVTPIGGPWLFTLTDLEQVPAPGVTGFLTKPFTIDPADPKHWSATI